jgi:hypothetical protein
MTQVCNSMVKTQNTIMIEKIKKHSTVCIIIVVFFVEYVPVDGRKRPKHVGKLTHVCILLQLQCIVGRDSVGGTATRYGLDSAGIESQ